jgi:DNA-binding FrmR family transcriptional regulator
MKKSIVNRIRRLRGQIDALESAIEQDEACDTVIPQLLAVRGALQSTCTEYLKHALHMCDKSDTEKVDRLLALVMKS